MTFKEKVVSKWKEVNYKTNNPTRTVHILINYIDLNNNDLEDKRFQILIEVVAFPKNRTA
ncbi:MAG: hypothetical protein ABJQ44_13680 [Flavobacteriaceae bacterium]